VADLKKGARITGRTRDKLAADLRKKYEKGASIKALAESTGRSYGFVHRVLSEAGVQLRGRGGATRTRKEGGSQVQDRPVRTSRAVPSPRRQDRAKQERTSPAASLDEEARRQGIRPVRSLKDLAVAAFADVTELEEFLTHTYAARRNDPK
jgi:hypothetical protein